MTRVVIDTNILVSALLKPGGIPAAIMVLALSRRVQLLRIREWRKPRIRVEECTDPDDNMFLERALAAEADYLVTGNLGHFLIDGRRQL